MIALRRLQIDDLNAVHALISNMEVVRHMLFAVCSREESEKFLTESINESPSAPWRSVVRAIVSGPGGELVGLCGIVNLRGNSDGEIWYLINPELWGKGIATKAVRRQLELGFSEMSLHRIWATRLPENPASARVLEKAGMRKEGFFVRRAQDSRRMEKQLSSTRDPSRRVVRVCAASGSQLLKSGVAFGKLLLPSKFAKKIKSQLGCPANDFLKRRTGCANQRPSGSVRGATGSRAVRLP